jgi:dUTPase
VLFEIVKIVIIDFRLALNSLGTAGSFKKVAEFTGDTTRGDKGFGSSGI